jgi:hypothetical protein
LEQQAVAPGSGYLRREYGRKERLARGQGGCGFCTGLAFGQAMSRRNMSFVLADPSRVTRYLLSLHFCCIYSGAHCSKHVASAMSFKTNLLPKINIPHSSTFISLSRPAPSRQSGRSRKHLPSFEKAKPGCRLRDDAGSFHQGWVGRPVLNSQERAFS